MTVSFCNVFGMVNQSCTESVRSSSLAGFGTANWQENVALLKKSCQCINSFHLQSGFNVALRPPTGCSGLSVSAWKRLNEEADFVTVWLGFIKLYWTQAESPGEGTPPFSGIIFQQNFLNRFQYFRKISWTRLYFSTSKSGTAVMKA